MNPQLKSALDKEHAAPAMYSALQQVKTIFDSESYSLDFDTLYDVVTSALNKANGSSNQK